MGNSGHHWKHRIIAIILAVALFGSVVTINDSYAQSRTDTGPKLSIFVVPQRVPADGQPYEIVYVAILDSKNNPITTSNDVEVTLTSSSPGIGSVQRTTTIAAGNYYALTTFTSTESTGSTTIYATTSGYASAQTTVTTLKSSGDPVPARLSIAVIPPIIYPDEIEYVEGLVIISLLNAAGSPVVATSDVDVVLSSSNENLAELEFPVVTIPAGKFYTNSTFFASGTAGQSIISARSQGLASGTASISTADTGASVLKVYPVTPVMSTASEGTWIVVQIEDSRGSPARASDDVHVKVVSSDNKIGKLPQDSEIVIDRGRSMSEPIKVSGAGKEGSVTITALASGYSSVSAQIQARAFAKAEGERQEQLMIYTVPPNPDPLTTDQVIVGVQLSTGSNPSRASKSIPVILSSANSRLGSFNEDLVISSGSSFGIVNYELSGASGQTTLTASAQDFETKQAQITVGGRAGETNFSLELVPMFENIPAYKNNMFPAFTVMLTNGPNNNNNVISSVVRAPRDIDVSLSSSNPGIADVPRTVKIPEGSYFAPIYITPSGTVGSLDVTARAEGFRETSDHIFLSEVVPTQMQVFIPLPILRQQDSHESGDRFVIVQLLDGRGEPAKNHVSDTEVALTLTPSSAGTVEQKLVVPKGSNFGMGRLALASDGEGTITANSDGYKLVSTKFKGVVLPMEASLALDPRNPAPGERAVAIARVTSNGAPLSGVTVRWLHDESIALLAVQSNQTNASGEAVAYYVPKTEAEGKPPVLTMTAIKPGFISAEARLSSQGTNGIDDNIRSPLEMIFTANVIFAILVASIAAEGFVIYRFYQTKRPLF